MMRALSLVVLLSLAACGAESPAPAPSPDASTATDATPDALLIFPGMPGASPCPSASVAAGSLWPDVVCDRGAGPTFNPRFTTVETCAMNGGTYRASVTTRRPITSSHPYAMTCPGVMLVTIDDAAQVYASP